MSAIDIFARSRTAENPGLFSFVGNIAGRLRSYNSYRRTLIALDNLTDRELNDLGLTRHQIQGVAYRVAYDG